AQGHDRIRREKPGRRGEPPHRRSWRGAGSGGTPGLSAVHGGRQSPSRRGAAERQRPGAVRFRLWALSAARRASAPACGHALGRRAADAGDRPRADEQSEPAAPRRAVPRPRAHGRGRDPRRPREIAAVRPDAADGRAEARHRARLRQPRLRDDQGADGARGQHRQPGAPPGPARPVLFPRDDAEGLMPVALVLAGGFLVLFVSGGARFSIGLTLKPMVDELGWLRSDLGLAVALYMVVSAFATFIAGRLADRLGGRAILGVGTVVGGVGIGLMCFVNAPWQAMLLYGVVFAIGNGAASLTTVGVMVTRAVPGRAGFANAFVISGQSLGQLVMIAILAAVLAQIGWRSVFVWLAVAHAVLIPILLLTLPAGTRAHGAHAPAEGANLREASRTPRFWLLLAIYAICGLDDFFVGTHVAAFAQDRGASALVAGNLLALMGLTALIGVLAGGWLSDRSGPLLATAIAFGARIVVFVLILFDQSPASVAIFALVFGATFMVTAPLTILFVREAFGTRHLGALTGLITMVHQIFGGIGAYGGALIFDATGTYAVAFAIALVLTVLALVLTLALPRASARSTA